MTDTEIIGLAEPTISTGTPQWDALIEGIVAHLLHCRGLKSPEWTRNTRLDESWAPNEHLSDSSWHLLNFVSTPVELLDKHIVFARVNLERL